MSGGDAYLRLLLDQAAAEAAFLDRLGRANDDETSGAAEPTSASPAVSLMITNQQRARLRELGYSDEAIRLMTPAEAHEQLELTRPAP